MGMIFLLFSDASAAAQGIGPELVLGVILAIVGTNGIPEAIGAGILVAAVGKALDVYKRPQRCCVMTALSNT